MSIRPTIFLALLTGFACVLSPPASTLLISEVYYDALDETGGDADGSAEFIEIINISGSPVSLDNFYLTDMNNPTATEAYYFLPADDASPGVVDNASTSDFLLRFPPGFVLQPDGAALVIGGALNWETREAPLTIHPSALVFESADTDAGVPDMINASSAGGFSLTNGGEAVTLFEWDQASDLVVDHDFVSYNAPSANNSFMPRAGTESVDGPDGDATASTYAADSAVFSLAPAVATSNSNLSVARNTATETGEAATGGNGEGGEDEPTEDAATTFTSDALATPGENQLVTPPAVGADWRLFE